MKRAVLLSAILGVLGLGFGCAHTEAENARYHEARARQAAEEGDYHRAARESRKAERDYERADEAPLP
jgi:hypothetical protein